MFLENSRDILNLVSAFAVVWLTVFLCWLLYYLVMLSITACSAVKEIRDRVRAVEEGIKVIRERFEQAISSLSFISDGVIKLIKYFVEPSAGSEERERSKKKSK